MTRTGAEELQTEIPKYYDKWLAQKAHWLSPFMKNHMVSLKVLDCGPGEAKRAADRINFIWEKMQSRKLGWFDTDADRWIWNATAIRESGLIRPDEYKANEQEQGAEDAAQPPQDGAAQPLEGQREQHHERPEPDEGATRVLRTLRPSASAPPIPASTSPREQRGWT